jgi:uncharacterized protein YqjF (DUF2071 family)
MEWYASRLWNSNARKSADVVAVKWNLHPLLQSIAHRPWPPPLEPWIMLQKWHDLLFAHWPLPHSALRPLVPAQLNLDRFGEQCWVGVVPFRMSGIRGRGMPSLPGLSRFPELNVRTYVTYGGKPGVFFFSLDAANLPAVWAARRFYHLPYFHAEMSCEDCGGKILYSSRRLRSSAEFRGTYRPTGEVRLHDKESLEYWLTERYCLFTTHHGDVYRGEIHHQPWRLQDAEAEMETNTVAAKAGIASPNHAPSLLFAREQEVLIWPLRRADS